jgi:G3E family GTPase
VITGFLGSGKTTLLNYILSAHHGKRIAVIENEFGEVGIDDALVKQKFKEDEEIFEMNNGCICCTVRGDLIRILKQLSAHKNKFDYVLIETTGLADPAPVAQTFFVDEEIEKMYQLDGIITVCDVKHLLIHLDEEKAEGVENESVEQVAFADVILFNKTDLVSADELATVKAKVTAINKSAKTFDTQHSVVDLEKILNIGAFDLQRILTGLDPQFLVDQEHQHDQTVSSVGVIFDGELAIFELQAWISELMQTKGTDLFRYKGILAVKGEDRKYVFHGVHMLFGGSFLEEKWTAQEKRTCKFIFIGRNLDREFLENGFKECAAKPLQFNVGDKVFANVEGGWTEATVLKLWNDGNAYRLKLLAGKNKGVEVFAPIDHNQFIRKTKPADDE